MLANALGKLQTKKKEIEGRLKSAASNIKSQLNAVKNQVKSGVANLKQQLKSAAATATVAAPITSEQVQPAVVAGTNDVVESASNAPSTSTTLGVADDEAAIVQQARAYTLEVRAMTAEEAAAYEASRVGVDGSVAKQEVQQLKEEIRVMYARAKSLQMQLELAKQLDKLMHTEVEQRVSAARIKRNQSLLHINALETLRKKLMLARREADDLVSQEQAMVDQLRHLLSGYDAEVRAMSG